VSKQISVFWWRWLLIVTIGVIIFSLGFIFLPDVMQQLFNWMLFSAPNAPFGEATTHYLKFVYGVLGAVIVGWMVTLLAIIMRPFRRGESESWNTITFSIVIWFVVDTTFSLRMGFPQNAIFNTLFFVLFAIPLGATYKQFHRT
jgi:uncharacterized membrane protein YhaH (DUF805 family)